MTDLKPCPFCGGEAYLYRTNDAACFNEDCAGYLLRHCPPDAWNTRAPVPITDAMVDAACLAMLDTTDALVKRMRAALKAALEVKS